LQVLHLQLMRFVYDTKTLNRKKVQTAVTFPKVRAHLNLNPKPTNPRTHEPPPPPGGGIVSSQYFVATNQKLNMFLAMITTQLDHTVISENGNGQTLNRKKVMQEGQPVTFPKVRAPSNFQLSLSLFDLTNLVISPIW
jgi:hypothetical protein